MRQLQEFRVTLEKGKEKKKDQVGIPKKVVDSTAEYLLLQSQNTLKREKENSLNPQTPIKIFNVWEDLGELKRPEKKSSKKETKK